MGGGEAVCIDERGGRQDPSVCMCHNSLGGQPRLLGRKVLAGLFRQGRQSCRGCEEKKAEKKMVGGAGGK